ncbi:MAG TPA: hypothetical protein PK887_08220 [Ignavibacteriales bacterium]|nr:hypothetical protein [Ignavibacteriales bacterium]
MKIIKYFLIFVLFFLVSCKNSTESNPDNTNQNQKIDWNYSRTNTNHVIAIIKDTTIFNIKNYDIAVNDEIGVFFQKGDSLKCCGKISWENKSNSITAWGDDPTTSSKDGLSLEEEMIWIIKKNNTNYIVYPEYLSGNNKFIPGGISKLKRLYTK